MCWDVAGADFPQEEAVGGEAEEGAGVDVAAGIANEYLTGVGMHGNTVGLLDGGFGAVGDETGGEDPMCAGVHDGIVLHVLHLGEGKFLAYQVERVATEGHVLHHEVGAVGSGDATDMCLSGRVGDAEEGTGIAIVVTTRGHPHLTTGIGYEVMEVYRHGDAFFLAERGKVYDGNGVLVVGEHVSAAIGNVYLAPGDVQAVGLETHDAGVHLFQRGGVYLYHDAFLFVIGIYLHRAGITADVGIALVEGDVAAIGKIDLPHPTGSACLHDLYLVAAIYHRPHTAAVDAQVVAHIAKFLDGSRVGIAIDIAGVCARGVVVEVHGALVAAHIALVEQVETQDAVLASLSHLFFLAGPHDDVVATGLEEEEGKEEEEGPPQRTPPQPSPVWEGV